MNWVSAAEGNTIMETEKNNLFNVTDNTLCPKINIAISVQKRDKNFTQSAQT